MSIGHDAHRPTSRQTWRAFLLVLAPFAWGCILLYTGTKALFFGNIPHFARDDWYWLYVRCADIAKVIVCFGIAGYAYYYMPEFPPRFRAVTSLVRFTFPIIGVAAMVVSYALLYRYWGVTDASLGEHAAYSNDPVTCLYFSIVTWTTLGYGDVSPSREIRLVAASEAFFGYIGMAMFIAFFAQLIARRRQPDATRRNGA
jgi:hypothetical protein